MIKIYYCNWDSRDKEPRMDLISALLGHDVEFTAYNYRLVAEEKEIPYIEPSSDEFEQFISYIDCNNNKPVETFFNETLSRIWDKYNDNPDHNFRSMCVGDVIEFCTDDYCIDFRVAMMGFKLLK